MSDQSRFPWRTTLFLSLALNLLIIGVIAGAAGAGVRLERESNRAVVERMPGPRAFLRALPPETRASMRRELSASWEESRQTRQAAIQARRDAFAAAAAEPYDAMRVRAAFERLRAADQAAIAVFHDNVANAFARLTPQQRREALAALARAAPASRADARPGDSAAAPASDAPETEQSPQDRREARRRRWRERQEERLRRQQDVAPQP
ncbi:MAG: periplasmic heavy metal sensor [Hyphomonadaceae bacterium]